LLLFVTANLLRSTLGFVGLYDLFATAGQRVISFRTFNVISPVIFIGGALIALATALSSFVSIRTRRDNRSISITGLELTRNWAAVSLALVALSSVMLLLGYVALEQLLTIVR
jgi:hypothetical protein